MKEQKKKRLIASLLLISCLISGYMLFAMSENGSKQLRSIAQVDSLIQKELTNFNIGEQQVRVVTTKVDSNFSRKTYYIGLPYQFSKTQFHAELNSRLHPYAIETPARVRLPEHDIDIHLQYRGTVIRTVSLQTDPDLVLNRNRASILISFEQPPNQDLLDKLTDLGKPIPIIVKIEDPMQASNLSRQLKNHYDRIVFWLQNKEGEDLIRINSSAAITKLQQLQDILPDASVLLLADSNKLHQRLARNTNLTFINADHPLLLDKQLGKASFFEELQKLRKNPSNSTAIITGNKTTLSWLQEKLPELKKAGIELIPPPPANFGYD